jgi:glucose-6-phosphate isomerase
MKPTILSDEWQRLTELARIERTSAPALRARFDAEPRRFAQFSLQQEGMLFDFSKQRISLEVMAALHHLWHRADVPGWIARQRAGEPINTTEQRAVLHTALREPQPRAEVRAILKRMRQFCHAVRDTHWRGATGEPITDIVNIGIGGSDLGPRMACHALTALSHPRLHVHFISNLDAADLAPTLARLNPGSTLFIIASKTFTTQETMTNAHSARQWLVSALGEAAVDRHFIALSTNLAAVRKFGITENNVFEFWDWVGGRFSLWSAIGLSLALAIGPDAFDQLLAGGHAMDHHFFTAPVTENLPATAALLGIWNINFLGAETLAVLPYSQSLDLLPAYLQQLEMESNGKQKRRDGTAVGCATAPIIWGAAGSNGQHAFYQLIHQGSRLIPCDFIALAQADFDMPGHHAALLAHCFAQSEALMRGKTLSEAHAELRASGHDEVTAERLAPFKTFPGNQPSSTLLLPRLDPYTLGQLISFYEHKIFVQGVIWGLNSFDQWGVEYGKQLAHRLLPCLDGSGSPDPALDTSTAGLLQWVRQHHRQH